MQEAIELVCAVEPKIKAFDATCEAPFFAVDKNVPTVIVGPGSLAQAHIIDEFVEMSEVVAAVEIYVEFVQRALRADNPV